MAENDVARGKEDLRGALERYVVCPAVRDGIRRVDDHDDEEVGLSSRNCRAA